MRIVLDVREACAPQKRGKGMWTFGFLQELVYRKYPLLLLSNRPIPVSWKLDHVEECIIPSSGIRWHLQAAKFLSRRSDIRCFVSTTSYILPILLPKRIRKMIIVHDLIAFQDSTHAKRAQWIEKQTLHTALKRSTCVCTVSTCTAKALHEHFPSFPKEHILPIFSGPEAEISIKTVRDGSTILCIGTLSPRKNQLRLIKAFANLPPLLRSNAQLLLIGGRGWRDADILRAATQTPGCKWLGYLPKQEIELLMQRASVLALPSLDEGFGLPLLEAFQRGIPVLTTECGSLKEVAQDAAVFVDPRSIDSIASGLQSLLTNSALCESLIHRGFARAKAFSWSKTVDLFFSVIETHFTIEH